MNLEWGWILSTNTNMIKCTTISISKSLHKTCNIILCVNIVVIIVNCVMLNLSTINILYELREMNKEMYNQIGVWSDSIESKMMLSVNFIMINMIVKNMPFLKYSLLYLKTNSSDLLQDDNEHLL